MLTELDKTTVIIVPRERFSESVNSLENVLKHTPPEVSIIYVGTSYPGSISRKIIKLLRPQDQWIQYTSYMSPNESRNLGLKQIGDEVKYVIFLDNDVRVHDQWVENLVKCAAETGAEVVSPVYTETSYGKTVIHAVGAEIEESEGHLEVKMGAHKEKLEQVTPQLKRQQVEAPEFHCVLISKKFIDDLGGQLDPDMRSTREHLDLALEVKKQGGKIYLEPETVVDYKIPTELSPSDYFFYKRRWSYKEVEPTMAHFEKKWGIPMDLKRKNVMQWRQRMAKKGLKNFFLKKLRLKQYAR